MNYTEEEKEKDFDYFKSINISFFEKHGHSFLAIKNQEVISYCNAIDELIKDMSTKGYEVGDYLIQECKGSEYDYTNVIMRLMVNA